MRLTLRNLLRFLDRTDLDPLERAQLEDLVNKSDRATAWIHRIKSLRTDQNKSAPVANEMSSIGNVTRYVDGIMTEQEAIEFEKTMLASDQLLAEVASVHWLVHQKRPSTSGHVSLVLRQTLYDIDRVFASSAEKVAAGGAGSAGNVAATSMTDLPFEDAIDGAYEPFRGSTGKASNSNGALSATQPPVSLEQLKQRSNSRSWMVVAIVIGTLVGTTSLSFWLGKTSASRKPVARHENQAPDEVKPDGEPDPVVVDLPMKPEDDPAKKIGDENVTPETDEPAPRVIANHPQPAGRVGVANVEGLDDRPVNALPRRPDILWSVYTPIPSEEFIGPIRPPRVVASSTSRQPTALFKSGDSDWAVVDVQSKLQEGDKVLVLSGSQATFQLGDAFTLTALGPVSFSFGDYDRARGSDQVLLEFGKIQVTSAQGDVNWLLGIESDIYLITMLAAQSVVDIQVNSYFPPGADPRNCTAVQTRVIRSIEGRSRVQLANAAWSLDKGTALIQSKSELSEWAIPVQHGVFQIPADVIRYVDRIQDVVDQDSRKWVESQIDIPAALINLKNDSRQEVRLAAMTWLAELGQFEFVVDYFGNEDNKSNWRTFLQAIRSTIHSNPAYAEHLFESLSLAGEADQPRWFTLILGYSPDELEDGADEKLVAGLSDSSLGIRALAIENLREITGGITYGYLPTKNTTERNRSIRRQWIPMLSKKEIRYATSPAPLLPHVTIAPAVPDPAGSGTVKKDDSVSK